MEKTLFVKAIGAALALGILFFPFRVTVCPEHRIEVLSDGGEPIAKAKIQRIWHFYSIGERGQSELFSDHLGLVVLPEKSLRVNLFSLIAGSVKGFLELGINASYGRHESVGVFASGFKTKWFHDRLDKENSSVILDRVSPDSANESVLKSGQQ